MRIFSRPPLDDGSPGDAQITVEPSMPQAAAVWLCADLKISRLRRLAHRLQLGTRAAKCIV